MTKNNSFAVNSAMSIIICTRRLILITRYIEPCNFLTKRALVSQPSTFVVAKDPNISHYLNLSICQRLSLPLYDTHPTWLSLTNELNFDDKHHQINSLLLVNLPLLINKFSFIFEGQSCRVRITMTEAKRRYSSLCSAFLWTMLNIPKSLVKYDPKCILITCRVITWHVQYVFLIHLVTIRIHRSVMHPSLQV